MANLDEHTNLTRAHLHWMRRRLDKPCSKPTWKKRFPAHILRTQAADLGLDEVANAALRVITFLSPGERMPQRGIGLALLHLCDTLSIDAEARSCAVSASDPYRSATV